MSDLDYDNEVLLASVDAGETFLKDNEESDGSQYLSIQLNNSIDLNELNGYDGTACDVNTQPNFYRLEGSDDLLVLDTVCDEDGHLQIYQYRIRLNDNGEYEGVPDGIELVPFENDSVEDGVTISDAFEKDIDSTGAFETSFVSTEVPDEVNRCLSLNIEDEQQITFSDSPNNTYESYSRIDDKSGILENQSLLPIHKLESVSHCKVEGVSSFEHFNDPSENCFSINNGTIEQIKLCNLVNDDNINENEDEHQEIEDESALIHPEHIFITEAQDIKLENSQIIESHTNNLMESMIPDVENHNNLNESEAEDYELVEGDVHITGDSETLADLPCFEEQGEPLLPAYVLQIPEQAPPIPKKFSKTNLLENAEKENVAAVPQINFVKTNPRSLLKRSYVFIEQNTNEIEPEVVKIDKRFIKNKEVLQARLFRNYIAQTKILHAPIRQERLPRKQTMKPVQRTDEEIIVQEVVVSSKGFVETTEDGVVKSKIPLRATEIVQLSDSDDDFKPTRSKTKKKALAQKQIIDIEIIISDSNDEDSEKEEVPIKKRRGRPPKPIISEKTDLTCASTSTNNSTITTR